jgi:hypothetical protein
MARHSFRGAGGAGAIVVPRPQRTTIDAGEYEATELTQTVLSDGDRRLEGALAVVGSGVLVGVGLFVAGWTFLG